MPLFQSESKCKTILMKMTLICMKKKLQGIKLTFFAGSQLAPKHVKVVANPKKLVAIMTHTKKALSTL